MKKTVFVLLSLTAMFSSFAYGTVSYCFTVQDAVDEHMIPEITEAPKNNYWFYGAQIVDYRKSDERGQLACMYQNKHDKKVYHYFGRMRNATVTAEQIEEFGWKMKILTSGVVNFTCKAKYHDPDRDCWYTMLGH